jgi:hypothetical protein
MTITTPKPPATKRLQFNPERLAALETGMWKAYYRRQPARLFGLLVLALREQGHVAWPRALASAVLLTRAAVRFGRATGDYERFAPDIERGYRLLKFPPDVDVAEVSRWELRWWVVRREIGLAAGEAAGDAIARLYGAYYNVPLERVAEAGRLRGMAAEVRDRGATLDPDGPRGTGRSYWPDVARLLRESYRSLRAGLEGPPPARTDDRTTEAPVEATSEVRSPASVSG